MESIMTIKRNRTSVFGFTGLRMSRFVRNHVTHIAWGFALSRV